MYGRNISTGMGICRTDTSIWYDMIWYDIRYDICYDIWYDYII